jgi:hypothetical protein
MRYVDLLARTPSMTATMQVCWTTPAVAIVDALHRPSSTHPKHDCHDAGVADTAGHRNSGCGGERDGRRFSVCLDGSDGLQAPRGDGGSWRRRPAEQSGCSPRRGEGGCTPQLASGPDGSHVCPFSGDPFLLNVKFPFSLSWSPSQLQAPVKVSESLATNKVFISPQK